MTDWREVFNEMVAHGPVYVRAYSRMPGVILPTGLASKEDLGLNFWLPRGARDTHFDVDGVSETLSFRGVRSKVFIPWSAVIFLAPSNPITGEFDLACAVFDDATETERKASLDRRRAQVERLRSAADPVADSTPAVQTPAPHPARRLRLVREDESGE